MNLNTHKSILCTIAVLILAFTQGFSQCGDSIDLGTWVEEGDTNNGVWTVSGGGFSVDQTINGDPTFYVSPDSFVNVRITGDIIVNTTNDDDWIGFVFGYIDPDTNSPTNYDFYLFDWKQANQNFGGYLGNEGFSLSKINGPITNFPQAFSGKQGPYVDLIATDYGNTKGWNDLQLYEFELTYTNTRVVISVDLDTIFDVYGCFPPGRFGFYNYSLSDVNYSNFSYRVAAAFEVLTPNVCLGDTAQFVALSDSCENAAGIPVNNTLVGWDWDFGDGQTSTDTNASHYYDSAGTYLVTLVVTDYLGCKDTAYSSVDIHANTAIVDPDTSICTLDSIPVSASTGVSYIWSNGDTTQTSFLSGAGQHSVTVTHLYGCIASDTMTITHLPLPTVNLGPDLEICNGDSAILDAGNAGLAHLWNDGSTEDTLLVTNPGTYYCEVTDSLTCSFTDTVVVSNFAEPTVSPPNPELCIGDTVSISASGAETYQWYPNFAISLDTGETIKIFTTVDTTYNVIGIDSNGCTDTSSFFVDVHALPTAALSGGGLICFGDSIQLTQTLTGQGPWNYSYAIGGNTVSFTGLTSAIDSFFVSDSGWYTPISVSDAKCTGIDPFDSTLVQVNPLPIMNIASSSDSLCFGSSLTLTATQANQYIWTPSTGLNDTTIASVIASPIVNTTYSVIGTTVFGCVDSTDISIEVLPLPVITFTVSDDTICLNDTTVLGASGGNTYLWTNTENSNTENTPSINATPSQNATFKVYVSDVFGCTDSIDTLINVDTLPVVSILPSDTAFCLNDSALISAFGANTYAWGPSTGLGTVVGSSIYAGPNISSEYVVTGTDNNGCKGQDTIDIEIYDLPVVSIVPDDFEMCIYDVDSLSVTGAMTYDWSPNYSISSTTNDTVLVQPYVDTSYVATGTDTNGCQSSDTVSIIVHPLPNVQLQSDSDSVCLGLSLNLAVAGAVNYTWTPSTYLNANDQANVITTPTQNINYTVYGTDGNGCVNTDDTLITIVDLPNISISPANAAICVGETQNLRIADHANSYVWDPIDDLTQDGNNNDSVVASPIDTTLYSITATNFYACVSDTEYTLPVTPLPILSITTSQVTTCTGEPNNVMVTGANTYTWSPTQYIANAGTANPTMSPPVTKDYYVLGTGPGGCQTTDTITLDVFPIPDYSAGGNEEFCEGESVQFQATGGVNYLWMPFIGLSNPNIANPICDALLSRTYTVTIEDANGCEFQDTKDVIVNKLPNAKAGINYTVCQNESQQIGGNPTGPSGSTYEWSPDIDLNSKFLANPLATPLANRSYTVTVTDVNGCKNTDEMTFSVILAPELNLISKPMYLCSGDSGLVTLTSDSLEYLWSPSSVVLDTSASATLVYPTSDSPITVVATNEEGCSSELEFSLDVKPLPSITTSVNMNACEGDTVTLTGFTEASWFEWTPRDLVSEPDSLISTATPLETTDFTLHARDGFGCESSRSVTAHLYGLPRADAGEDILNCDINTVYLGGELTSHDYNYVSWSPSENLSDPNGLNPYVLEPENVTYYLTVESPDGCFAYDSITVFSDCYEVVYIPSSFSPNDDGINEVFLISAYRVTDPYLVIRNRFGHIVFESNNLEIGWEGTLRNEGIVSPIGVYQYFFTYKTETGRELLKKGTVTLIR